MKNENTKIKFTTKWKDANIEKKKKKKFKTLFFSLGFIAVSTSVIIGFVFLIEKAKKNKN